MTDERTVAGRLVGVVVGLAMVLVVLLIGEGGFRGIVAMTSENLSFLISDYRELWYRDFQPRLTYVPHPYLGYVHVDDGPDDDINTNGFWGPERTLNKPSGVLRIACFGGSTTAGPESWPYHLEQVLHERWPGQVVQVDNYGMGGWTTGEAVGAMAHVAQSYAPDLLVVHSVNNDLPAMRRRVQAVDNSHYRRAMDAMQDSPDHALLRSTWIDRVDAVLVTVSDLYIYAKLWIVGPKPARANLHKLTVWDGEELQAATRQGIATYERNLRTLATLGEAIDAPLVMVTMPERPPVNDREPWMLQAQNQRILALSKYEGWSVSDVAALSEAMGPYFMDKVHLDDPGQRMKAEAIADTIEEDRLLDLR